MQCLKKYDFYRRIKHQQDAASTWLILYPTFSMKNYSEEIESRMGRLYQSLSEKDRRRYAAIEAVKLGYGGLKYIANLFIIDPKTIRHGLADLQAPDELASKLIRKKGGGRNRKTSEIAKQWSLVQNPAFWVSRASEVLSFEQWNFNVLGAPPRCADVKRFFSKAMHMIRKSHFAIDGVQDLSFAD